MGLLPALPLPAPQCSSPLPRNALPFPLSPSDTPSVFLATDLSCFDKPSSQALGLWLFRVPSFMWLGTNRLGLSLVEAAGAGHGGQAWPSNVKGDQAQQGTTQQGWALS